MRDKSNIGLNYVSKQPRPQGSLCHALEISGPLARPNDIPVLNLKPIRLVRLDSEHAQSDGKSVNRGVPELDLARGRDPRR